MAIKDILKGRQIKVIGIGGIGTALLPFLARYLNSIESGDQKWRVTLVDGDGFEEGNASRQFFKRPGNKAKIKAEELAEEFENVSFRAIPEFITPKNAKSIIAKGDIVLMGVDKHRSRKIVSERCQSLSDVVLISGGNDLTDGNVQVYIKTNGRDLTASIEEDHPEINFPKDKSPGEMSCQERALEPSSKQIIFSNMGAAWLMLCAFWRIEQGELEDDIGETYFDIKKMSVTTHPRNPSTRRNYVEKQRKTAAESESAGRKGRRAGKRSDH